MRHHNLYQADSQDVPPKTSEGTNGTNTPGLAPAGKTGSKRKERVNGREVRVKRAKDLGGVDDCIDQVLENVVMPLTHPEVYTYTGVPPPRGILLHGPPGCGKTLLATAIAGEVGLPFISISAPSLVSGMSGESEKKVRELFEEAKQLAPCLVFIDEIDAVTPKRENAQREMERRIVAQLLTCMDSLSLDKTDGKPVLIIGATNRPDSLDPALRRAGRFDREICMSVPSELSREQILKVLCRDLRLSGALNLSKLAKMTAGFVGADLSALTAAAGVMAIKRIFLGLQQGTSSADQPKVSVTVAATKTAAMDVMDMGELTIQEDEAPIPDTLVTEDRPLSGIAKFLATHQEALPAEQLERIFIQEEDFLKALPQIQPSSKREGFTIVPDVTWADIGALTDIRVELQMAIVQPIKRPELYKAVGINAPAGVLLWGPPGCGKTLLAKAVANESRANFISVRGPELLNKYVGESERAVRQVFVRAKASAPCVIFFDELDALVPRRDDSLSESSARVVNTLLTELDGLGDRKGVFVIAATNRPDIIDPAMMRPGRLDKPLFVRLPSPNERAEILAKLTANSPLDAVIDLRTIAHDTRCENFSGADLASLAREAAVAALRSAVYKDISEREPNADDVIPSIMITGADFEIAFSKVRPSVSSQQRSKYEQLQGKYAA
ncbi:P-loop containing nucleoside triphosphate hydrolase protein [Protomyces lactucae-debilis]|uniref:Peroxisomal ATPase PEX1 n=1 Tax=Protomyces lactucae-debilis TaxID=2754530 RepID=A0A1Y2ETG1_PROLT|nr:P-loop containing nucleoside triphosphate hydrolase protein [Protomyces lactucae-debilis]ORY74851.1 P-loop containing nucleoside triphosphate hydrolase protein [Protomyces lactucae-debilis]